MKKNNNLYNIDNNKEYEQKSNDINHNDKNTKVQVIKLGTDDNIKKENAQKIEAGKLNNISNEYIMHNNSPITTTSNNFYENNNIKDMNKYNTNINNQGINNFFNINSVASANNSNWEKCIRCSSLFNERNKTLRNICKKCLKEEIINQSKRFYVSYLVSMAGKINKVTLNDLNDCFINQIYININVYNFNVYQIIEEYIFNSNLQQKNALRNLIDYLKKHICLYCYKDINNDNYKIPCGCHFCSRDDLEYFFKYIISFQLTYNFKCSCAYEYKPKEVLELCISLKSNKIYENNQNFINHLESIFKAICCKCGSIANNQNKLYQISVNENFPFNFIHFICAFCINLNNTTKITECIICNKKHQYIPLSI